MSTRRQLTAYREIQQQRHEAHMRQTFGMLPIRAKWQGVCGCGSIHPAGYGYPKPTPCGFRPGDQIAKFRGSWWTLVCIERTKQEDFKQSARFILEIETPRRAWIASAWTNDEAEAERWRRNAADLAAVDPTFPKERVSERA